MRGVGQDAGDLAADRGILKLPGVEPKNIVAFTFTEKAAAELKERVTTLVTAELGDMTGYGGAVHRDHARVRAGRAADVRAATFKRNVLDDIQTRLFIDRQQRASGLTVTDAMVKGSPRKLKRYRRLAAVDAGACRSCARTTWTSRCWRPSWWPRVTGYRKLLAEKNYFDFTELLRVAVDLLAEDA